LVAQQCALFNVIASMSGWQAGMSHGVGSGPDLSSFTFGGDGEVGVLAVLAYCNADISCDRGADRVPEGHAGYTSPSLDVSSPALWIGGDVHVPAFCPVDQKDLFLVRQIWWPPWQRAVWFVLHDEHALVKLLVLCLTSNSCFAIVFAMTSRLIKCRTWRRFNMLAFQEICGWKMVWPEFCPGALTHLIFWALFSTSFAYF